MQHTENNTQPNTRKSKIFPALMIAIGAIIVLGLGVWLNLYLNRPSVQASNPIPPEKDGALTQKVNDIEINASNFRRDGDTVMVDVCYPLIDTGDWLLSDAALQYEKASVSNFYLELIESKEAAAEGDMGYRCDMLSFDVPADADMSKAAFIVHAISAYPREGEYCSAPFVSRVQEALADDGITVECLTEEWGETLAIAGKPETMSQATAEETFSAKLVPIMNESLKTKGPWVFSFSLEK